MKYNIDDFYIGELYISDKWIDVSLENPEQIEPFIDTYYILNQNKAIQLSTEFIQSEYEYKKYLTIFLKSLDYYICIHNDQIYKINPNFFGQSFCKNLISLRDLLPKISYKIQQFISIEDVKKIFDNLFNNRKCLFNNEKIISKKLYVGTLHLCKGYQSKNDYTLIQGCINSPQSRILFNNAKLMSFWNIKNENGIINYNDFKCLFLMKNGEILNLIDHQIYQPFGSIDDSLKSGYSDLIPLYPLDEKQITLKKALKKFNRYY